MIPPPGFLLQPEAPDRALLVKPPLINTGKNVFQKTVSFIGQTSVFIETQTPGASLHYTLDGSEPTPASPMYTGPLLLSESATVRALAVKNGHQSILTPAVRFRRITGIKSVEMKQEPSPQYTGHGVLTLVDGRGGSVQHTDGEWLGFEGNDLDVLVDLGESRTIRNIAVGFLSDQRVWIFLRGSRVLTGSEPRPHENCFQDFGTSGQERRDTKSKHPLLP